MPLLGKRADGFSRRQCTAHRKRTGERCKSYACRGKQVCRMHGGKSKRGKDHWNYRNGLHSKDVREASEMMGRFLHRPIEVRVVLYPKTFAETAEGVRRGQRLDGHVIFPNEYAQLPLLEQLRVLRAAKRQLNSQLHEVYLVVHSMEIEQHQAAEDAGPG